MELTWLSSATDNWHRQVAEARVPHALLVTGAHGVGKRCLAAWIAGQQLRLPSVADLPQYPFEQPLHADLHWLQIPDDKRTIGVDQVRELITELNKTSYEGVGKVAIIDPADSMTLSATNSLLKTLEEPAGNTLIVLIADKLAHIPATIFSRCQRVTVALPSEADSLAWLERYQPGGHWREALDVAAGAPLQAIEAVDLLAETDTRARELTALAEHSMSPIAVAERWAGHDPDELLGWFAIQLQAMIHRVCGTSTGRGRLAVNDSVLRRIDRRNLFCYLDKINRLRAQAAGSWNVQLTLESLLIDWTQGLARLTTGSHSERLV